MKKALIVGGASGIGLSIANQLTKNDAYDEVNIIDRNAPSIDINSDKIHSYILDLTSEDYSILDRFGDIDLLMITVGFGKLSLFVDNDEQDITRYFDVNTVGPIRVIKHFYNRLQSDKDFYCGVMVSIAGFMSSPFFSLYGASKAALKIFIESVNVELKKFGSTNRILNVSPGSIKGTSFNNGVTDLPVTESLASEIIKNLESKNDLFIPQYEEVFKTVLARYHDDFRKEGEHSYDYKIQSGRIAELTNNQGVIKSGGGKKVAIVTGGTKGIGKAIVLQLLKRGYFVYTNYANDDSSANNALIEFQQICNNVRVFKASQTNLNEFSQFTDVIKADENHVDCIVCNAGMTVRKPTMQLSNEDWEAVMQVAVNSHFYLIRDLYNIIAPNSRIIFIGSMMGVLPHGTSLPYGVSKSAVHALAKNLVKEFAGTGTTVNAIAPGFVETEWQKNKPQEIRNNINSKTACGRFAETSEVVSAIDFCIDNAFVNGSIIEVSGGYCYK